MPEMTELFGLFADAAVRGLVLLAVAGLLSLALWRASAAARHLLWTAALCGVLAMPALTASIPRVEVAGLAGIPLARPAPLSDAAVLEPAGPARAEPEAVEAAPAAHGPAAAPEDGPGEARATAAGAGSPSSSAGPARSPADVQGATAASTVRRPVAAWLLGAWLAGLVALLAPLGAGWLSVLRLERRCRRVREPRVRHLATRLALRLGLKRDYRLLVGPSRMMPMTWGIVRPAVALPAEALEWPEARLEAVLAHELAHVARRDCLTQLLAELTRAVHWFNPLAWVAERRLRVEREHACDDMALAGGAKPSSYASELLGLARSYRASPATSMAAVAMARPSQLAGRLLAVLDERRPRSRVSRAAALRTAALAALVSIPLAAISPADAATIPLDAHAALPFGLDLDQPAHTPTSPTSPVSPRSAAREDATTTPAHFPAAGFTSQEITCAAADEGWKQISHQSNDRRRTITMRRPGCELEVRMEGDVDFDPVSMEVARMGRNARLRIEEDDDRLERWLEVTPGAGGRLAFEYRVDRRDAPFDEGARVWYRSLVLELFRRAGFAAEERVGSLLEQGGVEAVLRELGQLDSDHVFALYARELLEQARLEEAALRALVRSSARRVESDHYMSEILEAAAAHQPLTGGIVDDIVAASLELDSDHYRSEVLTTVLASASLDARQAGSVLASASQMDSDHYKSEILKSVAARYAREPAIRVAYLRAAAAMESDHYVSEVLNGLLSRGDLSAQEQAEVLATTRSIESDHYRSEILKRVAARGLPNDVLRRAYFEAIEGIESDHYRGQALETLVDDDALQPDLLVAVLGAAARIESDHYLSEVLVRVAQRHRLEGATREAYLLALDRIESQHYRGRAAEALLRADRR